MAKTVAYLRTSTNTQDLDTQKLQILEYAQKNNITINEFIETTISTRRNTQERRIDELIEKLNGSTDCLIVSELSRLGRSTSEVINLINCLMARHVRVVVIKQGLDISEHNMQSKVMITMLSLFGELERDMISLRTKEALASKKAQGIKLGRPKGSLSKSKFDQHIDKIKELLSYGLSARKMAKVLGYTNHIALTSYIKKRNLRILS